MKEEKREEFLEEVLDEEVELKTVEDNLEESGNDIIKSLDSDVEKKITLSELINEYLPTDRTSELTDNEKDKKLIHNLHLLEKTETVTNKKKIKLIKSSGLGRMINSSLANYKENNFTIDHLITKANNEISKTYFNSLTDSKDVTLKHQSVRISNYFYDDNSLIKAKLNKQVNKGISLDEDVVKILNYQNKASKTFSNFTKHIINEILFKIPWKEYNHLFKDLIFDVTVNLLNKIDFFVVEQIRIPLEKHVRDAITYLLTYKKWEIDEAEINKISVEIANEAANKVINDRRSSDDIKKDIDNDRKFQFSELVARDTVTNMYDNCDREGLYYLLYGIIKKVATNEGIDLLEYKDNLAEQIMTALTYASLKVSISVDASEFENISSRLAKSLLDELAK